MKNIVSSSEVGRYLVNSMTSHFQCKSELSMTKVSVVHGFYVNNGQFTLSLWDMLLG